MMFDKPERSLLRLVFSIGLSVAAALAERFFLPLPSFFSVSSALKRDSVGRESVGEWDWQLRDGISCRRNQKRPTKGRERDGVTESDTPS